MVRPARAAPPREPPGRAPPARDAVAGAAGAASSVRNPERSITVAHWVQANVAGGRAGSLKRFPQVGHWMTFSSAMGASWRRRGPRGGIVGRGGGPAQTRPGAPANRPRALRSAAPRYHRRVAIPLAEVYRSLSILHGAGIGWPEAVDRATGRRDPRWRPALDALSLGAPLSEALAGVVPPIDLAGVRAGEISGRLEENLRALAKRHEDADRRDRRDLGGARGTP